MASLQAESFDFLVVGAGIIGLNISLSLKESYPDCTICIIEKESRPGMHASGRNSGVLHAGFYYTADSLKARFCKEGNQQLTEYCIEKGLPINRCGKLVVAANEGELSGLAELLHRGKTNGVELVEVDEAEAKAIEPRVITYQKALFSPSTATVSPNAVIDALIDDVKLAGIEIWCNTLFTGCQRHVVKTSQGDINVGYVVNTAGLYADKIASNYGFSQDYRILPFKGLYLYSGNEGTALNTNIYPVPDLAYPFLGVHFTVDVQGRTKIGPTAIPAFWREHYGGMTNFNFSEMVEILTRDIGLFIHNNFDFRKVTLEELRKQSRVRMLSLAGSMIDGISRDEYTQWGQPGIRAQLVNIREKRLEMDFCYEGDDHSFHVLNAVSPGFTCSKPFSRFLVEHIEKLIK